MTVRDRGLIILEQVEPGDQVYWHCDVIHAVEVSFPNPWYCIVLTSILQLENTRGKERLVGTLHTRCSPHREQVRLSTSSLIDTPPDTYPPVRSAEYIASQRASFLSGHPPYDFSGGEGEAQFQGRAGVEDVHADVVSQRAMGLEGFVAREGASVGERSVVDKANEWLFPTN